MAGTRPMRGSRGQYTVAGNAARAFTQEQDAKREQERAAPLYIADVPAGSKQDELRDFNRAGYRVSRPWQDEEIELFDMEAVMPISRQAVRAANRPQQKETFVERLIAQAKREKHDAIMCVLLLAAIIALTAAWGQKQVELRSVRLSIEMLNNEVVSLEQESEDLEQQITLAKKDERIRNKAQNELNMLRPERAQVETIYIQTGERNQPETPQQTQEPKMEMLDILLGLLDVFHIGE